MMGKELRICRIVYYTGTSHSKAFVSSVIKFHDLTGVGERVSYGHSKYSNQYLQLRKVAILFQYTDALGFTNCLSVKQRFQIFCADKQSSLFSQP